MGKSVTCARFRYTGERDVFYEPGKEYHLTVKRWQLARWLRITVECRHGFEDKIYSGSRILRYNDEETFGQDWNQTKGG